VRASLRADEKEPSTFYEVKRQGHDDTKYGQKHLLKNAPFPRRHTGRLFAVEYHIGLPVRLPRFLCPLFAVASLRGTALGDIIQGVTP